MTELRTFLEKFNVDPDEMTTEEKLKLWRLFELGKLNVMSDGKVFSFRLKSLGDKLYVYAPEVYGESTVRSAVKTSEFVV